jgi:hypothetical protein
MWWDAHGHAESGSVHAPTNALVDANPRNIAGASIQAPDTAHRWTAEGVVTQAEFTGAHLYHLAAAGCVLNDVYREAVTLGIQIDGVRVRACGGFDAVTRTSTASSTTWT